MCADEHQHVRVHATHGTGVDGAWERSARPRTLHPHSRRTHREPRLRSRWARAVPSARRALLFGGVSLQRRLHAAVPRQPRRDSGGAERPQPHSTRRAAPPTATPAVGILYAWQAAWGGGALHRSGTRMHLPRAVSQRASALWKTPQAGGASTWRSTVSAPTDDARFRAVRERVGRWMCHLVARVQRGTRPPQPGDGWKHRADISGSFPAAATLARQGCSSRKGAGTDQLVSRRCCIRGPSTLTSGEGANIRTLG